METYSMGQELFWAKLEPREIRIQCPDCFGNRFLTVILGDGEHVTIECTGCQCGYEPPRGWVKIVQYQQSVIKGTVSGIEIKTVDGVPEVEYRINGRWWVKPEDLAMVEEIAKRRADEKAGELSQYELERFYSKEKPKRDWGWQATYHQSCIRHAKEELDYHTAKLNVALNHKNKEASCRKLTARSA